MDIPFWLLCQLSRLFLKRALHNAKQLLGNFKDSELIKAEQALNHPFAIDKYSMQIEINSIEKEIFDYSQLLQHKLLITFTDSSENHCCPTLHHFFDQM